MREQHRKTAMITPVRRALALAFLLLFAGNFVLAATPELPVGDVIVGAAPRDRWQPSIGENGRELFAVWTDSRAGMYRVFGTRVDEHGSVLDQTGIPISGELFSPAFEPRVVWNGSFWMAFWTASIAGPEHWAVAAARIDRDGHLAGAPYFLATGSGDQGQNVASNGNVTVVAITDANGVSAQALILDRDGNLVRKVSLPTASAGLTNPAVATDGNEFVIAWQAFVGTQPAIEAVRLDASGQLRDTTPTLLGPGRTPFLASDGANYLLLSQRTLDEQLVWSTTAIASTLTTSETKPLPDGKLLQSPSLLYRNGSYYVVAQRNSDIAPNFDVTAISISRDNIASQPASLADLRLDSVDPQTAATITSTGKLAVIWHEVSRTPSWSILTRARLFDGLDRASSAEPILLSRSANPQYAATIAYGAGMFVVAWRGIDGNYATRMTADGRSLDGVGVRIDEMPWSDSEVAFDGANFVLATQSLDAITLRFLSPTAGLRDETITIPVEAASGDKPALAISPDAIFVAWIDNGRTLLTRIPHATHNVEMPITISSDDMLTTQPRLAWNGTNVLVSWSLLEEIIIDPPIEMPSGVFAARVSPNLNLLDAAPIIVAPENSGSYFDTSIASNGKDWLFVWTHGTSIEARRITSTGTLGEPALITDAGSNPRVIFDGRAYAISWKESDPRSTLRLASLTSDGPIVRSSVATIAPTDTRLYAGALAATTNGIAAAYSRISNAPEHGGVERAFVRVMRVKKRAAGS